MPIGRYEDPAIRSLRDQRRNENDGRQIDHDAAWIAERQGGHVHRAQLLDIGLSASAIDRRLAAGRLHRTGWMTYCVGHRRTDREARLHGSLLAAGDGSALSHLTGGVELGLVSTRSGPIEIAVPRNRRAPGNVRYHRRRAPADEFVVVENGLATTSVGRTLFDLAGRVDEWTLRRAAKEVEVQGLDCRPSLTVLLDRHPRSPGAALVRAMVVDGSAPANIVLTDGEERFLQLVRRSGLPEPAPHYGISLSDAWLEVDFAWPDLRIAVEVDSSFHEVPIALETDHDRDQGLLADGWVVFRVTWRQLHDDPDLVLRRFRKLFATVIARRSSQQPRQPGLS